MGGYRLITALTKTLGARHAVVCAYSCAHFEPRAISYKLLPDLQHTLSGFVTLSINMGVEVALYCTKPYRICQICM